MTKDELKPIDVSKYRVTETGQVLKMTNEELAKKAGRPKWHKVADGDYPPCEKGNYTINVLTDCGDIAYYDYNEDCWIAEPSSVEIDPPIAWCEIPKYTEE